MDYRTIREKQERDNEAMRANCYEECDRCCQWTTYMQITNFMALSDGRTRLNVNYYYHCCDGKPKITATNCYYCGCFVRSVVDKDDEIIVQGICKRCDNGVDYTYEDTTDTANAVCPHCGK